jgi:hypothetical protein
MRTRLDSDINKSYTSSKFYFLEIDPVFFEKVLKIIINLKI